MNIQKTNRTFLLVPAGTIILEKPTVYEPYPHRLRYAAIAEVIEESGHRFLWVEFRIWSPQAIKVEGRGAIYGMWYVEATIRGREFSRCVAVSDQSALAIFEAAAKSLGGIDPTDLYVPAVPKEVSPWIF